MDETNKNKLVGSELDENKQDGTELVTGLKKMQHK